LLAPLQVLDTITRAHRVEIGSAATQIITREKLDLVSMHPGG
jgi:hypothetical protein